MDKELLLRWLSNALKNSPVDCEEVFVGDETDSQTYVLFKNLETGGLNDEILYWKHR